MRQPSFKEWEIQFPTKKLWCFVASEVKNGSQVSPSSGLLTVVISPFSTPFLNFPIYDQTYTSRYSSTRLDRLNQAGHKCSLLQDTGLLKPSTNAGLVQTEAMLRLVVNQLTESGHLARHGRHTLQNTVGVAGSSLNPPEKKSAKGNSIGGIVRASITIEVSRFDTRSMPWYIPLLPKFNIC